MVEEILHYPKANIILNDGDEIRVEYIRKTPYSAKNSETIMRMGLRYGINWKGRKW